MMISVEHIMRTNSPNECSIYYLEHCLGLSRNLSAGTAGIAAPRLESDMARRAEDDHTVRCLVT